MFENKMFDVEHAINMYAYSYAHIPAFAIYDKKLPEDIQSLIERCHIYLIGTAPIIDSKGATQEGHYLFTRLKVLEKIYNLCWPMKNGEELKNDNGLFYVLDRQGQRIFPSNEAFMRRLCFEHGVFDFQVQYIGQAYGKRGSRNAVNRLRKHETLQKISLLGVEPGYAIQLLLLEINTNNMVITLFNPQAKNKQEGAGRIKHGVDKLFGTTEKERITLYEASLIRYFRPKFNIEFKDSFPSTSMKVLQDRYAKDFASVGAEICFDDLPFRLFSERVKPKLYHIIAHDLHDQSDRKVFFGMNV